MVTAARGHMNTRLRFALFLTVFGLLPSVPLGAQEASPGTTAGPRLEHTATAMRSVATDRTAFTSAQARTNSVGKPVALMAVGAAAIVVGTLIGHDVGTLFSIGGAVALLYGLYLYLR